MPPFSMAAHVLPDVLCQGLLVVFCGTAAGTVSASRGAYYAGPGNRFWRIIAEIKLTPRRLQPDEFRLFPTFGIGLTDIAKSAAGADSELPVGSFDVEGFTKRIRAVRPKIVAFNGKRAGGAFFGIPRTVDLAYGPCSPPMPDFPAVFVLPSTSGAASGSWSADPWRELAARIHSAWDAGREN